MSFSWNNRPASDGQHLDLLGNRHLNARQPKHRRARLTTAARPPSGPSRLHLLAGVDEPLGVQNLKSSIHCYQATPREAQKDSVEYEPSRGQEVGHVSPFSTVGPVRKQEQHWATPRTHSARASCFQRRFDKQTRIDTAGRNQATANCMHWLRTQESC
ncbi:hypothetical protein BC835DRAFT_328324 [Cytidiella melzeri]|nr:hypothetical protein BC835DRAFT_328324 [Cytidiella melzeri]